MPEENTLKVPSPSEQGFPELEGGPALLMPMELRWQSDLVKLLGEVKVPSPGFPSTQQSGWDYRSPWTPVHPLRHHRLPWSLPLGVELLILGVGLPTLRSCPVQGVGLLALRSCLVLEVWLLVLWSWTILGV